MRRTIGVPVKSRLPAFIELDAVSDGDNTGTVYRCRNHRTGEEFLAVKLRTGPRAGEWDKPWRYWPLIHWSEHGRLDRCPRCRRPFHQVIDGPPQSRCRTCTTVSDRRAFARERALAEHDGLTREEMRAMQRRPWRWLEGRRPIRIKPPGSPDGAD